MFKQRKSYVLKLLSVFLLVGFALSTTPIDAAADKRMLLNIQKAIKAKNGKWKAGENEISRLPRSEQTKLLGLLPEADSNLFQAGVDMIDEYSYQVQLPATFDWRNHNGKNYMTSVKRQRCGDCWAFSAAAALEGRMAIDGTPGLDLSEQFLVADCFDGGSCGGGYIVSTARYLTDVGMPRENCYPYLGRNSSCGNACDDWQSKTIKAQSYTRVNQTVAALKAALYNRGPVYTGYMVYEDFSSYTSGIYEHTWGAAQGGHAVVIVGYDDTKQCFIVKNSWGTGWGENGYFRIAYSQVTNKVDFGSQSCVFGDDISPDPDPDPDPEPDNELDNGQTVSNLSASAGQWVQYKIKVPADAINLKITTSGGNGDVDLYTKFGSEPTLNSYDCRPYKWGNNESCSSDNPSAGYFYIGLYGYNAFSGVSLTATYESQGPGPEPSTEGVQILGSWDSGTSHATESGTNRALIFTAHAEDNDSDVKVTSVTYGGRALQKVKEQVVGTRYRAYVAAYILDEAGIEAADNDRFVVTWSQTPYRTPKYSSAFLGNVNQATLADATAGTGVFTGTADTAALPTEEGDLVLLAATCGNQGDYTPNNGFTEAVELSMTSADGMVAYKSIQGGSEVTPSITHSNANRQALIGVVVAAE